MVIKACNKKESSGKPSVMKKSRELGMRRYPMQYIH